jgi:RNA polymerase sigma-70 factor (ECF subfamily)
MSSVFVQVKAPKMAKHATMALGARLPTAATVDFDALYREHSPQVRTLAYQRLGDWGRADDVVQETFLRAYRALDRLDPDRPAWPWLRTIAEHICTDIVRRLAVVSETPVGHHEREPAAPGDADPNAEAYLSTERWAGIQDALGQVSPRQRRMLMLQAVEGWTPGAVAEAEGMTVTAVRATLKRGRQNFRRHYLALAARRGLLGAAVARCKARAERTGLWGFEALPAGFVSVVLVVGAVTGAGRATGPRDLVELDGNPGGTAIVAITAPEPAAVGPHVAAGTGSDGRGGGAEDGPTTGWEKSVGTAPGPVGVDAKAGVSAEDDERFRIGTRQRIPGRESETEVWLTIPCEGSVTGAAICRAAKELPDE